MSHPQVRGLKHVYYAVMRYSKWVTAGCVD